MGREPTQEEWRQFARLASEKKDSDKLIVLTQKTMETYHEEQRAKAFASGKKRKLERDLGE